MNETCIICGKLATEKHHLKSRKSGGPDAEWNLLPIDRACHTKIHQAGLTSYANKYPTLLEWLLDHGWVFDLTAKKWRHYDESLYKV